MTETRSFTIKAEKTFLDQIEKLFEPLKPVEKLKKTYEILKFQHTITRNCYTQEESGWKRASTVPDFYSITSVKRLSDGEAFSIGDKVEIDGLVFTIKIFREIMDKLEVSALIENSVSGLNRDFYFDDRFKKLSPKPVILTTEDGVDIKENDIIWWIYKSCPKEPYEVMITRDIYQEAYNSYFFSSKESAEEYILMNKPINITLQQIKELITDSGWYAGCEVLNKIKKLLK